MPLPWNSLCLHEAFLPTISLLTSSVLTSEQCLGRRTLEKSHFRKGCPEFLRKEKWLFVVSGGQSAQRGVQDKKAFG